MNLKVYSFLGVILTICQANGEGSWPQGTYGLPKAKSGCPDNKIWKEGWRKQDLDEKSKTSSNIHMDVQVLDAGNINRTFCVKTVEDTGKKWPQGFYCIYKAKDSSCPTGMTQGAVQWDDIDIRNANKHGGTLPDGVYDSNTKIKYCCQNKGNWSDSIELPVDRPFYLLPHNNTVPRCQLVKWAASWLEFIDYDTVGSVDKAYGDHVFFARIRFSSTFQFLTFQYCYYEDCRYKMNSNKGVFTSLNRNAWFDKCSWSVKVEKSHVISIQVTKLQRLKCQESYLAVYDGVDEESPLLQKYCDSEIQSNLTLSSGNQVFVILKYLNPERAFGRRPQFEVKYAAQQALDEGTISSSSPTNQSVAVKPRNQTSDSKTGLIAGLVVVFILVLMLVLLVIFRAKVIQCLKTHCFKSGAQAREQTETTAAKPAIVVITSTENREATSRSNGLAKPSLVYENVTGEHNLDECNYTDLNSVNREPENIYQSLEYQERSRREPENDQNADYYVNIT